MQMPSRSILSKIPTVCQEKRQKNSSAHSRQGNQLLEPAFAEVFTSNETNQLLVLIALQPLRSQSNLDDHVLIAAERFELYNRRKCYQDYLKRMRRKGSADRNF
jgi:hypothetical protein